MTNHVVECLVVGLEAQSESENAVMLEVLDLENSRPKLSELLIYLKILCAYVRCA